MTEETSTTDETGTSPDEAFSVLGNETRIRILRVLGEADGPLSFTELRDRVGIRQGSQFNYHLERVAGHFVRKGDDGYELRQAGRRVIQAVLSGAVTDDPVLEPTRTDMSCWFCGAPIEVSFREERATAYCTECGGAYGESGEPWERSRLGYMYLPPAGIQGRTAAEVYRAAVTWGNLELLARACRICPHCSAPLEDRVNVCETHDASGGLCPSCDRRHSVLYHVRCTNCIYDEEAMFMVRLLANTEVRRFLIAHGIDPVSPDPERFFETTAAYDEDVRSTEPFEARFTFTVDDDALTLNVDDDLDVVHVRERRTAEPDR